MTARSERSRKEMFKNILSRKKITFKIMKRQQNAKEPSKWNGHGFSRTREIRGNATRDSSILSTIGMRLIEDLNVEKDEISGKD